jgi:hypothetical protein
MEQTMEQHDGERSKGQTTENGHQNEGSITPTQPSQSSHLIADVLSQRKALESQLKDSLKKIHVLVGEKVEMQNSKESCYNSTTSQWH